MEIYQISFSIAIALVILEMLTGTFILLGFGIGTLFVGTAQYLFSGLSVNRDLLIFSFFSLISIYALRKIFKSKSDQIISTEEDINRY